MGREARGGRDPKSSRGRGLGSPKATTGDVWPGETWPGAGAEPTHGGWRSPPGSSAPSIPNHHRALTPSTTSKLSLSTPGDGDATTPLGNPSQRPAALFGKKYLFIYNLNLPWHTSRPFLLLLSRLSARRGHPRNQNKNTRSHEGACFSFFRVLKA